MKLNLILIFCAIYSINCLDTKLEQICIEDTFDYNDLEVNSYFHVELPIQIPVLNELLISESINFEYWSDDKNEIKEMNSKKNEYNNLIKQFFNQDNVNNFNVTKLLVIKKKVTNIRNYFKSKADQAVQQEYEELQNAIKISYDNLGYLISLKKGRLNSEIVNTELLAYLAVDLLKILGDNGVLAFGDPEDDKLYERFYAESIAKFEQITFDVNEEEDEINKFSIYVPVHKNKYNTREKCTNAIDLPDFYSEA